MSTCTFHRTGYVATGDMMELTYASEGHILSVEWREGTHDWVVELDGEVRGVRGGPRNLSTASDVARDAMRRVGVGA